MSKKLFQFMFFLLFSSILFANSKNDIAVFKLSWVAKALQLQREIDISAPLNEATFLGTHNSYNSTYYATPLRYLDPNQDLSIYEQLDLGARSLELDAHWTLNSKLQRDILLCHGRKNQFGCSVFDRKFTEGLGELRAWLKANPSEVVLLYIERMLEGHEPRLAAELNEYVGEYIFTPAHLPTRKHLQGCTALPTSISKADILKAKKQLLIVTKDCDTTTSYQEENLFSVNWKDVIFTGIGTIPSAPYTFIDSTITHFNAYPDCSQSNIFTNDPTHNSMWRIFEDVTRLSNLSHAEKKISTHDMGDLVNCGINWPTIDKLSVDDPRLKSFIWSWAEDYPKENHGSCAIYKINKGIENMPCTQASQGYLCKEKTTHALQALSLIGPQTNGETACQLLAGKNWHFSSPINGKQRMLLDKAMQFSLLQEIWINYTAHENNHWMVNN